MDGAPHTHAPELRKEWPSGASNYGWYVVYGDTKVRVCDSYSTPKPEKVEKAFAKAVREHDEGSLAAQAREDAIKAAKRHLEQITSVAENGGPPGGWLSSKLGFLTGRKR